MKGSIRKNPKTGKYDITVDIGRDPGTGKRKQKMKRGFLTKQEAEKAITKILNDINEGIFFEPQKITVKDFYEMWFKERRRYCRKNNLSKPISLLQYLYSAKNECS